MSNTKYIFVTGGVVSGLGKGITAASLGRLLKQRGLKVAAMKLDPYMNVNPGLMNPLQHGEVFVTDDGAETDLDLGHYERFIDESMTQLSTITSGRVHQNVLNNERNGMYGGNTVQVIPHITNEIMKYIYAGAEQSTADIFMVEIGGTVGDIESQPFLETIRQISIQKGRENCLFIHVTLVPYLKFAGEHKSKPTQHSVKELRMLGISPDIIVARADEDIPEDIMRKIALFCNVKQDCVIENVTASSLYEVPLIMHEKGLDSVVCRELKLDCAPPNLCEWQGMVEKIRAREKCVTIAIVGKYTQLSDAYLSVIESLNHAGFEAGACVKIKWIDSVTMTAENANELLSDANGIVVPGGFGCRGMDGKILAAQYAREHDVPFLGISMGMQVAVIEFARNVAGLENANSDEFDELSPHKVIIMPEQIGLDGSGGTMRLGAYPCALKHGTKIQALYQEDVISERHRHRYEFNHDYRDTLEAKGMTISGISPDNKFVEAVELPNKKFYIGVQFHPEFKSRPNKPHPLFVGLIRAAIK